MKRFILTTLFFLMFVVAMSILLHVYVQTLPNDYTYKNECLEKKAPFIKILNLGNSQSLYAINPACYSEEGFNLAYVSQTLDIDYLLLDKYIDRLESLEYVIIQVSYTSFFEILGYGPESWRVKNYERFYHVEPLVDKSKQFNSLVINERNNLLRLYEHLRGKSSIHCNEYGFDESYAYEDSKTDFSESALKTAEWHAAATYELAGTNRNYLEKMIGRAKEKNVQVIIYIPPVHFTYRELLNETQLKIMYENIEDVLKQHEGIIFYDWSAIDYFNDRDFYDCDHLNDSGAKKLTLLMDSLLLKTD